MLDLHQCSFGGLVMSTSDYAISLLLQRFKGGDHARKRYRESLEKLKPEVLQKMLDAQSEVREAKEEARANKK